GAMTNNLLKIVENRHQVDHVYISAGRKAATHIAKTKKELIAEFKFSDVPKFAEARAIAKFAIKAYLDGEVDRVDVLFTNFINTLTQEPETYQLLPVGKVEALSVGVEGQETSADLDSIDVIDQEYVFEPTAENVFISLLPHYLNYRLYQILLESKASEHSSRMVAMKNATDNAKQLIKDLTLEYNKVRQAAITNELLEITSAAMAVG
ncbi:MAG TPA: F0F1 ATP synthase subunit gamma, partial [Verrucomicrobia bacterium]|nr:F0F1 ATP synthase subunit gamma [Verrucomicrobiota bacterium]